MSSYAMASEYLYRVPTLPYWRLGDIRVTADVASREEPCRMAGYMVRFVSCRPTRDEAKLIEFFIIQDGVCAIV